MRKLLYILPLVCLFIQPLSALAITGDAARYDFSVGVPAITADNTSTCNNAATVRFDFSLGQPAEVFDGTATCTAAATPSSGTAQDIIFY